jgi:putative SOS response-associated peptidase YedK
MCGRFTLRTPTRAIVDAFELAAIADLPLRYNIAPTQQVAVVRLVASLAFGRYAHELGTLFAFQFVRVERTVIFRTQSTPIVHFFQQSGEGR